MSLAVRSFLDAKPSFVSKVSQVAAVQLNQRFLKTRWRGDATIGRAMTFSLTRPGMNPGKTLAFLIRNY